MLQADTLTSMQDVITQSNGAISEVRGKLQEKEEVIHSLEEQLQARSRESAGTHNPTSPYINKLLDYKASPMRDILLTDSRARTTASPSRSDFHFKSPVQRLAREQKTSNASSGGFIINDARVDNFVLPTPINSPGIDDQDSPFYANAHKLAEARYQRKESNMYMSYMEPVGASTLIGQSMMLPAESPHPSPVIRPQAQVKPNRRSPVLRSHTTRAKADQNSSTVPFVNYESPQSNHLYPSDRPPPREQATRKTSRCHNENNATTSTLAGNSSTHESTLEYVEQIISPTPRAKYLEVFKEQGKRKRPLHESMSSVNSSVNQSVEGHSVRQPRGKIQKLVQHYEFSASMKPDTRRRVLPPRQAASTRRRSLNSKRKTPPTQRQRAGNHTARTRTNKATELRMLAQKKTEDRTEKKLFSIGKF